MLFRITNLDIGKLSLLCSDCLYRTCKCFTEEEGAEVPSKWEAGVCVASIFNFEAEKLLQFRMDKDMVECILDFQDCYIVRLLKNLSQLLCTIRFEVNMFSKEVDPSAVLFSLVFHPSEGQ
ncbi:MAG: hypothetical protein EZS28_008172 [Streblomastix strix]|uniref:Uncharacterized protein n=1 Tax=Streblomastix strix TaxID=222440 RepID=A0A5J4WNA1_9EUKA|nr:MAG: hypothetical protein EZS28_008172 [Streblomastix strix]